MAKAIELGVCQLQRSPAPFEFDPGNNYPVYLDEPLVALRLGSFFGKLTWPSREEWLARLIQTAPDQSTIGYIFEMVAMFTLVDKFGGQFTELGKVFELPKTSPFASKKYTIASLNRRVDGSVVNHNVSWTTGASDRIGFKAQSPDDVLKFLANPKGKPFLFPDNHMGPDLTCFLVEETTKDLIFLVVQCKIYRKFDTSKWLKAIKSVEPSLFYMVKVRNH